MPVVASITLMEHAGTSEGCKNIYVMGCILGTFKPGSSCEDQGISHSNLSKRLP